LLSACGAPPLNNWPGLVADQQRAYVASGSFIYAVDLADGREAWRYPAEADNSRQFFSTLALTPDGQLLAGSAGSERSFVSLDPTTGRENWDAPFSAAKGIWLAPPLALDGLIYAPNSDGWLYILEADGAFVRSVELGGSLWSQPVTDGALLYVASLDHHLHVIDPTTHAIVRTIDLGGAIPGSPTPATDGVYVGSFTGKLEFVSAAGRRQTLSEVEDWIWGAPTLDAETLYFADLSGKVYSLDLESGRQNWGKVQPDGPIAASPLLMGDMLIIVTESGSVHAFDRQGQEVWPRAYETGGKIYTSPVASAELILVAPYQAEFALAALDTQGQRAWLFTPEE
jgi:outer membrane protein assembly factor BamB